jgi:hypothetical protein
MKSARFAAIALIATTSAVSIPALAAGVPVSEATAEQKAGASDAYKRGRSAYDQGLFDDALAAFQESYDTVASPNAHLMIATTLIQLGRKGEAYEALDAVIAEAEQAAAADPKYSKTADGARTKQQEIAGDVGTITVLGVDQAPPGAALTVNGREIPQSRWSSPISVNAGMVDVSLTGEPAKTVDVGPGGRATVDFGASEMGGDGEMSIDSEGGYSGPDRMLITYIAGGVGVAGLISFGVFGGLAKSKYDSLEDSCPNKVDCPLELESDADSGKTFQIVANVSLGVGIAGVAVAAGFLTWELLDPAEEEGDSADGSDMAVSVGPGSVSLTGSF